MTTLVVDSSVCLKWVFNDEIDSDYALDLQKKYLEDEVNLIAPNLWIYEMINGLKTAHLKKPSIPVNDLEIKLDHLIESSPNLLDISDLSSLCLKYSLHFNISAYDGAYLALAHANGLILVTADDKLATKINDPNLAISLKDYYNKSN